MAQEGSWHWVWHLSLLFSTHITKAKQPLQAVLWLPHTGPNITHIHIIMINKILLKIHTRHDDTFTTAAWDRNQCLVRIQIYYTKPSLCPRKPTWSTEDQASCTVQEKGLNPQVEGLPLDKGLLTQIRKHLFYSNAVSNPISFKYLIQQQKLQNQNAGGGKSFLTSAFNECQYVQF